MPIKGLSRAGKDPAGDAQSLRDFLQQFSTLPFLSGVMVTAVIPVGVSYVIAPHNLGWAYTGGFLSSISYPVPAIVQTPDAASGAGVDVQSNVLIFMTSAVGFPVTVNMWVF